MSKGFDVAERVSYAIASGAQHVGFEFVGRYLCHDRQALTLTEVKDISRAGLHIVSIYEWGNPTSAGYFSHAKGGQDGGRAVAAAQALGQTLATAIYVTVDYDASQHDLDGDTGQYLAAFHAVVKAAGYVVGVYGSALTLTWAKAHGYASRFWLAYAPRWGYGHSFAGADIVQGKPVTVGGLGADLDTSNGNAGGWRVATMSA